MKKHLSVSAFQVALFSPLLRIHERTTYVPALAGTLFLWVLLLSPQASAQDTTFRWRRPNVVKTNLLAPVSLFYERAITPRFALRTSARWFTVKGSGFKPQDFVNATLEAKWYTARPVNLTAKDHPTGFFVNPYVKVRSKQTTDHVRTNPDEYEQETIKSAGFGLTLGYQWVTRQGWVIDIFHGMGAFPSAWSRYRRFESDGTVTTRLSNDYLMMDLRSGVSLGYAF